MKIIELPRLVVTGDNVFPEIPEVLTKLDVKKSVLLAVDDSTWRIAGKDTSEILNESGYDVSHHKTGRATFEEVDRLKNTISETEPEILIGIGGGTVIDLAKLSSFQTNRPFIALPTAASHDGIVSPRASITQEGDKHSVLAHSPMGVIVPLDIIRAAPPRFLAAGCGDIIGKETAVLDWELAARVKGEPISRYASSLAKLAALQITKSCKEIGLKKPGTENIVVKALISSSISMCIAGSSRPASGSEHLFSHALDLIAKKPALHGEQVGIGTILMSYLHGTDWKNVKSVLTTVGAPTTAEQVGISDEEVIQAIHIAHTIRPERYTILGDGIPKKAAEFAAKETGVISS